MTPQQQLEEVAELALGSVASAQTLAQLDAAENEYLGRKNGRLTGLLRLVGSLPLEEKPAFGAAVNARKEELLAQLHSRRESLAAQARAAQLAADAIDVTLPGIPHPIGSIHPISAQIQQIKEALIAMGYSFGEYPDIEEYHYNFEMLNYPPDHPAFDEQMSFYIDDQHLLRTQTTAFQARVMEKQKPPIRAATIGKCYRYEAVDATHSHTFHQCDLLAVDEGLSMADLKGTFAELVRRLFGNARVRFRPDYFPFVEPGVELAIEWGSGWLELGGAGLVHPNILHSMGIDPERYTGFAWGLGIDRMPMAKYAINDIRLFAENDLRFLRQF